MNAPDFLHKTIRRAITKRAVRMVLLKDDKAYEKLYNELTEALTRAWNDQMRKGIADSLDRLRDLGKGKFTQADARNILTVFENAVGGPAIAAALRDPVVNLSDALVRVGAAEVGTAVAVDIAFSRADLDALDLIKRGNLFPVTNSWDAVTRDRINPILKEYFTEGMTREGLAKRFAEDFTEMTQKGRQYWELLSDHMATKTREMGRVTGYQRAGIEFVQVRANRDDKTTKICRDLHGRTIAVSKMSAQRKAYLDAVNREDTNAAQKAWMMRGNSTDFSKTPTESLPDNVGSPPYHFRCRTITVAYFPSNKPVDQWQKKLNDREVFTKEENKDITARAKAASWLSSKQARGKFQKHRAAIPAKKLKDFEASARGVIEDPKSIQILSSRVPLARKATQERTPHAVYIKKAEHRSDGRIGYLATIIDLKDNQILSHHWRDQKFSENDEIPGREQKWKRYLKWLIG